MTNPMPTQSLLSKAQQTDTRRHERQSCKTYFLFQLKRLACSDIRTGLTSSTVHCHYKQREAKSHPENPGFAEGWPRHNGVGSLSDQPYSKLARERHLVRMRRRSYPRHGRAPVHDLRSTAFGNSVSAQWRQGGAAAAGRSGSGPATCRASVCWVWRRTRSTLADQICPASGLEYPRARPPTTASTAFLPVARISSRLACDSAVSCAELLTSSRDWSASATRMNESHPCSDAPSGVISRGDSDAPASWADDCSAASVRSSAGNRARSRTPVSRRHHPHAAPCRSRAARFAHTRHRIVITRGGPAPDLLPLRTHTWQGASCIFLGLFWRDFDQRPGWRLLVQ